MIHSSHAVGRGTDQLDGPGLAIPEDAIAVMLTVEHWYETTPNEDGARVVIDSVIAVVDQMIRLDP